MTKRAKKASISIIGMTCASCVQSIEEAVSQLPGVGKIVVNLETEKAQVEYAPEFTPLSEIMKIIKELGYEVVDRAEGQEALDREQEARRKEIRRQFINLIVAALISFLVMVGTFQPYWFLPQIVPDWMNNKILLFFLTTPIVFGPGRQFFVNSWNGLRRGVTDMNLLYATGIGAAYIIAVINTFWPGAGFGGKWSINGGNSRC